ncbi:hypothetical protein E4T43_04565 [Aureobasidium subglaciale]|nr:hypothetical protein E4T43_04565 [Aureobasidium subglaciale]
MSTSQAAPKSILKKTSRSETQPQPSISIKPKSDSERKRLETAIQHAHLIQEQKSILAKNLDYIEELSEYPSSSTVAAATDVEVRNFLNYMISFQPSDYDALIEERHVNGRCGYTLCPNPPRTKPTLKAPWLRNRVENWCSDGCAKKALYVKAQLDETPAWERRAGNKNPLVLYDEKKSVVQGEATQMQLPVREKPKLRVADEKELAYERGEVSRVEDEKMDKVLKMEVLENKTISSVMPPTQTSFADSALHDLIEGYQPRGVQKGNRMVIKSDDTDSEAEEDA